MPSIQTDTWAAVLDDIKNNVGERRFSLWFSNVRPLQLGGDVLTLGVPNLFVQEWLDTHFHDVLRKALTRCLGKTPAVKFRIDPELFRESRKHALEAEADLVREGAKAAVETTRDNGNLRPDFTLKNFVVGACNKLAHACAVEIIESRSNRFHPLFIHSRSGLGKSHLLQAILHELLQRGASGNVAYVTAETFTNQFIYAMRKNRLDGFRHRYRNVEVLIIDDVHFFSRKSGLQEELLHTFDVLENRKRQIILASDVHPKMLMQIKQSLVSRFASGMVVRMGRPDYTTRVAILKSKLQQQRRRFPPQVVNYIARGFEGSVRELIGAVTSVVAYSSLTGEKVGIPLVKKALARVGPPLEGSSGLQVIERVVSRHYCVKPSAWHGARLTRALRFPRQVCMYLARKCSDLSCREIAQHFGSPNHSTVVFAVKRVEDSMKKDPHLGEFIAAMVEEIRRE